MLAKRECVIDVRAGELVVTNDDAGMGKESESAHVIALASFLLPAR